MTDDTPPINSYPSSGAPINNATDISMKQMNKTGDTDDEVTAGGQTGEAEEPAKKDKSVLQAKLTKLAIQIGYAGTLY